MVFHCPHTLFRKITNCPQMNTTVKKKIARLVLCRAKNKKMTPELPDISFVTLSSACAPLATGSLACRGGCLCGSYMGEGSPAWADGSGREAQASPEPFLSSTTQKTELIRILHFLRTCVNQGLYAVYIYIFFQNSKLN